MTEKKTFTQTDAPVVTVTPEHAAEYNRKAREWAQQRGLPAPDELSAGTNTLCNQNTTTITNTPNSDGNVDNMTDAVVDDSGGG